MADNRYRAARSRRPGLFLRPRLESLEERTVPADLIWTGGGLGNGTTIAGDPRWSNPLNWNNGTPQDGDTVIFPAGANQAFPTFLDPVSGVPVFTWAYNSFADVGGGGPADTNGNGVLDLDRIVLEAPGYLIGGDNQAGDVPRVQISGQVTATYTGNSTLSFSMRLAGVRPFVVGSGATLSIDDGPAQAPPAPAPSHGPSHGELLDGLTATGGVVKDGAGTLVFGQLAMGDGNSYSRLTQVSTGALVVEDDQGLGDPVQGTQVFAGAVLRLGQVDVQDEGLVLVSGTTAGQAATLQGSAGLGQTARWRGAIDLLNATANLAVDDGTTLRIDGTISGAQGFNKTGTGALRLDTPNTYQGVTNVQAGTIDLRDPQGLGATTNGTVVQSGATLAGQGLFTVTNESLTLEGTGVGNNGAFISNAPTEAAATALTWNGPVTLASPTNIGAELDTSITIIGGLNAATANTLTKVGAGTLVLPNANPNFLAAATVLGGVVELNNALSLGPSPAAGGSITVDGGVVRVNGTFTINKPLSLTGFGFGVDAALQASGTGNNVNWSGPITLSESTTIGVGTGNFLTITGGMTGGTSASLQKLGEGTLILPVANTYLGSTTLQNGVTRLLANDGLGGADGLGTTIADGATLEVPGPAPLNLINESLVLAGAGESSAGALHVIAGSHTVSADVSLLGSVPAVVNVDAGSQVTFAGSVGGGAGLTKVGAGTLEYAGTVNNTAGGATTINGGTLLLNKSNGALAVVGGLFIGDDAGGGTDVVRVLQSNQIRDDVAVTINSTGLLDLNNQSDGIGTLAMKGGVVSTGAMGLLTLNGNVTGTATPIGDDAPATINGNLSLGTATRTFVVAADPAFANDLVINAVISGEAGVGLTKGGTAATGAGTLFLGTSNTYSGPTNVDRGTLKLGVTDALADTSVVSVNAGATLDATDVTDTLAALRNGAGGGGSVLLGSTGALTSEADNTTGTFGGTFTGGAGTSFTRVGTGTLTLSGNSPAFLGTTSVSAGTLLVTGIRGNSPATVASGATLGGTGTVGPLTAEGNVAPGTSPGVLTVSGDADFDPAATFTVEINGPTPGNDANNHDQLNVTGDVSVAGTLVVTVGAGFIPSGGTSLTIIQAGGTRSGTFTGLPDGASLSASGFAFRIHYTANSVELVPVEDTSTTVVGTPNPAAFGANVTLTATVTPASGAGTAPGTVDLIDSTTGALLADDLSLSGGQASILVSTLTPGPHDVIAVYGGDTNFGGSTSSPFTQNVNNGPTTTVLAAGTPNPSLPGQAVTFTATVTSDVAGATALPSGNVTFFDGSTPLTGTGGTLMNVSGVMQATFTTTALTTVGMHNVTARYVGDTFFAQSPVSNTVFQTLVEGTTTVVTGMPDPAAVGTNVTLTATVMPASGMGTPMGTIDVIDTTANTLLGDDLVLMGGMASIITNALTPGPHDVIAIYTPAGIGFTGSTSAPFTQDVNNGPTTTVLAAGTPNPSLPGQAVTFTATVTSDVAGATALPSGNVTFFDGSTPLTGTGGTLMNVSGVMQATFTTTALTTVGMHNVTARYVGDTFFAQSPLSNTVFQQVDPAATTTTLISSGNPSTFGQLVTFTATVHSASAGATAVPTGTVNFFVGSMLLGSAPLNTNGGQQQANFPTDDLSVGTSSISAVYTGDTTFDASPTSNTVLQQVDPAATTTTLISSGNPSTPGQMVTFTATASALGSGAVPTGTVVFTVDGNPTGPVPLGGAGQASFVPAGLAPGSHLITAAFTSNSPNFTDSAAPPLTQAVGPNVPDSAAPPLPPVVRRLLAVGAGPGSSHVRALDAASGAEVHSFIAFEGFLGEVTVGVGDVDGDGVSDVVVGAGPTAPGGHVKVFSGADGSLLHSFFAFEGFRGGVFVAAGDVNGDGFADLVVGAGPGAPGGHVKVFDGATGALLRSFFAFEGHAGGVSVGAGDVNGDGFADLMVGAGPGAPGGHVKAFDGAGGALLRSFFAFEGFRDGVFVAGGDVNGDGRADVLTGAAAGASPHVKVFDGADGGLLASFLAFDVGSSGGVRVGAVDRDGDGAAEVLATLGSSGPVRVFSGPSFALIDSFFAFGPVAAIVVGG